VQVLVQDPEAMMFHAEVVRRDGRGRGLRARGLVWLHAGRRGGPGDGRGGEAIDQAWLDAGRWEVAIAGATLPRVASLRPLYDPVDGAHRGTSTGWSDLPRSVRQRVSSRSIRVSGTSQMIATAT
jgi:hypothetical protein